MIVRRLFTLAAHKRGRRIRAQVEGAQEDRADTAHEHARAERARRTSVAALAIAGNPRKRRWLPTRVEVAGLSGIAVALLIAVIGETLTF